MDRDTCRFPNLRHVGPVGEREADRLKGSTHVAFRLRSTSFAPRRVAVWAAITNGVPSLLDEPVVLARTHVAEVATLS